MLSLQPLRPRLGRADLDPTVNENVAERTPPPFTRGRPYHPGVPCGSQRPLTLRKVPFLSPLESWHFGADQVLFSREQWSYVFPNTGM
jgi:hypothetical protein